MEMSALNPPDNPQQAQEAVADTPPPKPNLGPLRTLLGLFVPSGIADTRVQPDCN